MSVPSLIEATARIVECRRAGVYLAEMPNGHVITAFVTPKYAAGLPAEIPVGSAVIVRLTTHDFSSGMILRTTEAHATHNP